VNGTIGGIWDAAEMGKQPGWKNLHQYKNMNSPKGAEKVIGKEIWEQFGKSLDILTVSLGTGGTVLGIGPYLKNKNSKLYIIANPIKRGSSIPGPRGEDAVKKLFFPWEKTVDLELPIAEKPAFEMSLKMIREGLFVGPSTGMQLAGILEYLGKLKKEKKLKKLAHGGKINAMIIACDTMFPYIEDYFSVLPEIG
jgi:cysteine synthase A